jgi:hypothetical protein
MKESLPFILSMDFFRLPLPQGERKKSQLSPPWGPDSYRDWGKKHLTKTIPLIVFNLNKHTKI